MGLLVWRKGNNCVERKKSECDNKQVAIEIDFENVSDHFCNNGGDIVPSKRLNSSNMGGPMNHHRTRVAM